MHSGPGFRAWVVTNGIRAGPGRKCVEHIVRGADSLGLDGDVKELSGGVCNTPNPHRLDVGLVCAL